ncbi:MAG: matrixin family metalloprotease [Acidobacteriia bacterium]|nr:matrixin family metalloprotease [Terriglobia bacterium]
MRFHQAAGTALLLAAQCAWAGDVIHLKARTVRPAPGAAAVTGVSRRAHFIVQFPSYPGPEIRQELQRRGVRVLGYVPDNGLMISADAGVRLEGLDLAWSGNLEAADKLSPLLSEPAPAYLVVFHSDIGMEAARALAARHGFTIVENPSLLPGQLVAAGSPTRLEDLAAEDEVSYILPASADLVAGATLMACGGAATEAGQIGEYATVGRGWAKDAAGEVTLRYLFESLTSKLDANTAQGEIERAFREWTRYAEVGFTPGGSAQSVRTIAVGFGRRAHGDSYPFDGPGGVLAHTFYPAPPNAEPIAGDMHFDDDENWKAGADTDLFTVALHEAGHALGLGHSDRPGSVMYPYYRFASGLTADDIAAIRSLYGAAAPADPGVPPAKPPADPAGPPDPPAPPVPPAPPSQPPARADKVAPSLRILSPRFTIVSTSSPSLTISGTAADNVGVAAVKWSVSTGAAGNAAGTGSWSAEVPLLVGTNVVTIRASDQAGNSGWRAITVVRR